MISSVIATLTEIIAFLRSVMADAPILGAVAVAYPVGCLLAIYWTQSLKRAQARRYREVERIAAASGLVFVPPRRYTSLQLRSISALISGNVIGILLAGFFQAPNAQLLAHMVLGGAAAPGLMWIIISVAEWKSPALARRLKCGDRRNGQSTPDRRDPNDTGQFWNP